jgi:cytochrome P450
MYMTHPLTNAFKTPISQSTYFVHNNPEVFADPFKFAPERWVEAAEQRIPLNNYLTSFTKGSRQCLGIGYVVILVL